MKPAGQKSNLVTVSVRVERETAAQLKRVADAEFRPVAAELRRMILERIEQADLPEAA